MGEKSNSMNYSGPFSANKKRKAKNTKKGVQSKKVISMKFVSTEIAFKAQNGVLINK